MISHNLWEVDNGFYSGFWRNKAQHYTGDRQILTLGPNGSGKTRRSIYTNLRGFGKWPGLVNWSMLVIDPKGEIYRETHAHRAKYGKVIKLDPYGTGDGFNPIAALDPTNDEFVDDAFGLAESVISTENTRDVHWPASAQDLTTAFIMYARLLHEKNGAFKHVKKWLSLEVVRPSKDENGKLLPPTGFARIVQDMILLAEEKNWPEMDHKIARYSSITPDSRELLSIISTAIIQSRWLDSRKIKDNLDSGTIDFAAMKNEPITIYLILPAKRLATQSPWPRLVVTACLQELMRDAIPGKVPVMLLLEEAGQIGAIPAVQKYMAMMRGYGIKLWSVYQDIHQIQNNYGKIWQSFVANAGVMQAFAPQDMGTADFLSKRTAQTTMHIKNRSENFDPKSFQPKGENVSEAPMARPGLWPHELLLMPPGQTVVFSHKFKEQVFVLSQLPDPSEL